MKPSLHASGPCLTERVLKELHIKGHWSSCFLPGRTRDLIPTVLSQNFGVGAINPKGLKHVLPDKLRVTTRKYVRAQQHSRSTDVNAHECGIIYGIQQLD